MSKFFLLFALFIFSSLFASAQDAQTLPTPAPPPSLNTILDEAAAQAMEYREAFRDLLAVETKTFDEFDKNGEIDDTKKIESNFFVYHSSKNGQAAELRNVFRVDDKPVADTQERADRFLGELQKAKTAEKELEKIADESLRFDKSVIIYGLTLFEAIVLAENLRPFFDFSLAGEESYKGRNVYVVNYKQNRKSPYITINEKKSEEKALSADFDLNLPGSLKKAEKFLQGKLWIDAENFQLLREERDVVVNAGVPLVAQKAVFEYEPSEYEIYVPRRITFTDYDFKKDGKNAYSTRKASQVTFDYSEFKKTDVEIEILDDDGN